MRPVIDNQDSTAQEIIGLLPDRSHALELELEIDGIVDIALNVMDPVPRQHAERDAAGVVLDADETLERAPSLPCGSVGSAIGLLSA